MWGTHANNWLDIDGTTVHPHVCGELHTKDLEQQPVNGSSPRVWGTLLLLSEHQVVLRFIPTCVGNSCFPPLACADETVHPHVCGELLLVCCSFVCCCGSSPRVWGTRSFGGLHCLLVRFIPTCVGNSLHIITMGNKKAVHPHVCGELLCFPAVKGSIGGSSPRVWGTRAGSAATVNESRFIPTCVGNSVSGDHIHSPDPVHPHVCGELVHGP